MSAAWTSADLKAVVRGGEIAEDVLRKVFDISRIPLPMQDRIGSGSSKNAFHEWLTDSLAAVDTANARVDGSDPTDNDATGGLRVGNHHQISSKTVKVSTRAQVSDTLPMSNDLARQVMRRNQELRRDVDAILILDQPSLADDGTAVAGLSAGLPSWLTTNTNRGATGADGGFGATTADIVDAATPGTERALTETFVKDMANDIWKLGGDPSVLMSVPDAISGLSTYMFTSSARIAAFRQDQGVQSQTAVGYVNVFLTDFDVQLEMVGNRLQELTTTDNANVFIITPSQLSVSFLHGYRMDALAKTGLSDERDMTVDFTMQVGTEEAHGVIADIDPALTVTT